MGITESLLVPEIDRAPKNAVLTITSDQIALRIIVSMKCIQMQEKDDGYLDEGDDVDIIVGTPTGNPVVFSRHNSRCSAITSTFLLHHDDLFHTNDAAL